MTFGLTRDGGFSLRDRAAKIAAVLLEISISELNELQTAQQQNLPTLSQAQGREAASAEGTFLKLEQLSLTFNLLMTVVW